MFTQDFRTLFFSYSSKLLIHPIIASTSLVSFSMTAYVRGEQLKQSRLNLTPASAAYNIASYYLFKV